MHVCLHQQAAQATRSPQPSPLRHAQPHGSRERPWPDTLSLVAGQVQRGLNLCLRLKSPAQMPALLTAIQQQQEAINASLASLHYVHFARFLPTGDGTSLWVITVYDGDLQSYLMDFVKVLGEPFNAMLAFVQDAPRLPVQMYPRDFIEWVHKNNNERAMPWSAYKDLTVIDIQSLSKHV
jgi:hypothetical protein